MDKKVILPILLVIIVIFFFPKIASEPVSSFKYWKKSCLGFEQEISCSTISENLFLVADECKNYVDYCFGVPIGREKCYGMMFGPDKGCKYPCNDRNVKSICELQEKVNIDSEIFSCDKISRECDW